MACQRDLAIFLFFIISNWSSFNVVSSASTSPSTTTTPTSTAITTTITKTTTGPVPMGPEVEVIRQTTNGITLNITKEGDTDCFVIRIENETVLESPECTVNISSSETSVQYETISSALQPGNCYTFHVAAKLGNQLSSEAMVSGCTLPSTPANVTRTGQTESSISLIITKGPGNVDCFIISDTPIQEGDSNCIVNSSEITSYVYINLTAGNTYRFSVKAKFKNLLSSEFTSTEMYTVPTVPRNLTVTDRTRESFYTTWSHSNTGDNISFSVTANCTSPNTGIQTVLYDNMTEETEFNVTGLTAGSSCVVEVLTFNGDVQSSTAAVGTFYNRETAPSEVSNLQIPMESVTARSILVRWAKPSNPNGVVRRYEVHVEDSFAGSTERLIQLCCSNCGDPRPELNGCDQNATSCTSEPDQSFVSSHTELSFNVTDLMPHRIYRVRVTPFTQCAGPDGQTIDAATDEAKQEEAPTDLMVSNYEFMNDTWEITLSWSPPVVLNGNITEYAVQYRFINDTLCYQNVSENARDYTVQSDSTRPGMAATILTLSHKLRSDWTYWFKVAASTDLGKGNFSEEISFTTPTSRPGTIAAESVIAEDATDNSVALSWDHPCKPNGEISNYVISWQSQLSPSNVNGNCGIGSDNMTTQDNSSSVTLNLLPSRNYTFYVAAQSKYNGTGNQTHGRSELTLVAVPYQPNISTVTNLSATSAGISWTPFTCDQYVGPTNFTVEAINAGLTNLSTTRSCTVTGYSSTTCEITGLEEYWGYRFQVTATTQAGHNVSVQSDKFVTQEAPPGDVLYFQVTPEANVTLPRKIRLTWEPPSILDRNGIITGYILFYRNKNNTQTFSERSAGNTTSSDIYGLSPGYYNIKIFATTRAGNGSMTMMSTNLLPGAPIKPTESDGFRLVSAQKTTGDPIKTVAVQLPLNALLCNNTNGKINKRGVIVAEESKATDPPFAGPADVYRAEYLNNYKTWAQVRNMDSIPPYLVTSDTWNPCGGEGEGTRRKRSTLNSEQTAVFIVGNENCESVSIDTICNGELPDGRTFRVKVYACSNQGCTETEYSGPLKTEKNIVPTVVGSVVAIVVLAAVIVTVLVLRWKRAACFRKENGSYSPKNKEMMEIPQMELCVNNGFKEDSEEDSGDHQVPLVGFPTYVDRLFENSKMRIAAQYKKIKELSPNGDVITTDLQACRDKCRYTNIMPFEKSRVKLLPRVGVDGSFFINANYIPGYTSKQEYIATQWPLSSTINDFWRMVWEQNAEVIVLLTECKEPGKFQNEPYWPDLNTQTEYGDICVTVESESTEGDTVIRILKMTHDECSKKLRQICFLSWPDMGRPDETTNLLEFIKTVRKHMKPNSDNPMIVHGNAGVGRTGTFIAVDYLLKYIMENDKVDVFKLVLDMRNYRCNMVHTEEQYAFIHECLRDFLTDNDEDDVD